jgi:TPR repeat protein
MRTCADGTEEGEGGGYFQEPNPNSEAVGPGNPDCYRREDASTQVFEFAEGVYDKGERDALTSLCVRILDADDTGCALFWLGVLHFERGKRKRASFCFSRCLPLLLKHRESNKIVKTNLAWMYSTGEDIVGVERDAEKAVALYKEAVEEGLPRAQTNLGVIYLEGRGVPENQGEGLRLLNLATESGYLGALSSLASIFFFQTLELKEEGLRLFYTCAEEGHPRSLYELGWIFMNGHGDLEPDKLTAMDLFHQSAERGNPEAANNLGWMYEMGEVYPVDIQSAVHFYEMAIDGGSSSAEFNLGCLYERGVNGRGALDAVELYKSSTAKGNLSAHHSLGRLHFWGIGIEKSKHEAVRIWKSVADRPGLPILQYDLGSLYSTGDAESGINREVEEAIKLLHFAWDQGHEPSRQKLIELFEIHVGSEPQAL